MRILQKIALIVLLLQACIKADVSDIDISNIKLNPEFAIPIGQDNITFNHYFAGFSPIDSNFFPLENITDTCFFYIDKYYFLPGKLYYNIEFPFNLNQLADSLSFIKNFTIKTNINTNIPGEFSTQVYFKCGTDTMARLFQPNVFELTGASVNNKQIYRTDIVSKLVCFDNPESIAEIFQTDNLCIKTWLDLPAYDSVSVCFLPDLDIWVQVAATVTLNIVF